MVVVVAAALVPGAGQQLAGLLGDRAADLPHQGPDPRDLGAEPVIVLAQPVVVSLKLRYLPGERLQRCHDVLAWLVRRRSPMARPVRAGSPRAPPPGRDGL